jgi:hypothetical protein
MAKWKRTLKIGDLHWAHQSDLLTAKDLGQQVAARIRDLRIPDDDWIEIITDNFEYVETIEDYDDFLEDLYDWGDRDHRLWVDTFDTNYVSAKL